MSACEWWSLRSALAHFATFRGSTQSQRHIKPLHWYVACRLVVEGGFDPDEIVPRPPFRVTRKAKRRTLVHDPSVGGGGERTIYGGLKTKSVDVDEGGLSRDRSPRKLAENDVALDGDGRPVESIRRFHAALRELADRRGIRNDVSSYEAIAFALASTQPERAGAIIEEFPEPGGALRFEGFFDSLYRQYDERFVYAAPELRKVTARREWDGASPAFDGAGPTDLDYEPRVSP